MRGPSLEVEQAVSRWRKLAAVYLAGAVVRALFVLVWHRPSQDMPSDARHYMHHAELWLAEGIVDPAQGLRPPGTMLYLAFFRGLVDDWSLAAAANLALSLIVPALLALLAWRLTRDERVSLLVCVFATLYVPFIDTFGYFLAEGPFLVSVLVATITLVHAIDPEASDGERRGRSIVAGLSSGVALAFKGQWLLPLLGLLGLLTLLAARTRDRRAAGSIALVILGMALVVAPASAIVSRANGRPTILSSNACAAAIVGHAGAIRRFHFEGPTSRTWIASSVALQRGHTEDLTLPFAISDGDACRAWLRARVEAQPGAVLTQSLRNVGDLVLGEVPWPASEGRMHTPMAISEHVFRWLVLLPAFVTLLRRRASLFTLGATPTPEQWLTVPLVGLALTAALSHGEPRFRIPFDGLVIVLAAMTWAPILLRRSSQPRPGAPQAGS